MASLIMPEEEEEEVEVPVHYYSSPFMMSLSDNKEFEDDYYEKKIMELFESKRKKFGPKDIPLLAPQVKERKKVIIIKRRRPTVVVQKKKSNDKVPIVSNELTQRLKEYIASEMSGKEVKVVIQKRLFASDLEKSQNRLNMPINQLETRDFLTENEKRYLDNDKEFEVELLGPGLRVHGKPMVMKKWHLRSSDNYVLKTNWNNFVNENERDLKVNTMIQVLSFRKDEKLHFAIACLEREIDAVAAPPISRLPPPAAIGDSHRPLKKRVHFAIECLEKDVVGQNQNDAVAVAATPISSSHLPPKKRLHFLQYRSN